MVSIYIIRDVNFDHMANMVSVRILHWKLALFPSLLDFLSFFPKIKDHLLFL